ncbi:uncharacterized protein VP01_331g3 [Puccinia sorghi]|uniref:SUZ domain-containing protein n=1 Tax=Puccinia sorghi TaxID=27349 RepID=A0A0L6UX98_9BASI|nr:uncharacterized protein VP01_331g3 [Puccinia sorghi]
MEKEQEPEQPPLDQTLIEAINNGTIRDKQILLTAESEMGRFIASNLQRQPLSSALSSSLNSYQRMLVHRLGDSFGVNRIFDSGQMFIERTESTAWPTVRLETLMAKQKPTTPSPSNPSAISTASTEKTDPTLTSSSPSSSPSPSLPAPTQPNSTNLPPPKAFKIMSRTLSQASRPSNRSLMPSTASSGSSIDCGLSESRRNEMSYEERQAAYLEARNRIFANSSNNSVENSAGASTAGSTSSSAGASPEDDRLSITTSTSKKSKALSDPPPESGSNSVELNNSSSQPKIKDSKSDSSRTSNKNLSAKLRPSATSFDPSAKAHGYEEVTIIEVDDQSITVPHQGLNLYNPYLANNHYPPAYPNGFLRDPRFGAAPPTNNQNHGGFPTGSHPIHHRSYQNLSCRNNPANFSASNNNSNSNAGMAPALVHPPYQSPQAQTGSERSSMPTMIGTVPLAPISPHVQTNGSTSNRSQSFPARAPEVGYNSPVVYPPPPLAGDPSLQYPPSFLPPPPPQRQQRQPPPHPPHLNHTHHQPNGQSNSFHSEPNGFHSPDLNHHHQQQRQLPPHSTQGYHPNHPRLAHPPVDPVTGYAWATPLPPLLPPQNQQFRENGHDQAPDAVHPPFSSAIRPAGASPDAAHRPPTNCYAPPISCAEPGPPHRPHSFVSSSNTTAPADPPSDHKSDGLSGSFSNLHLHAHPPPHPHSHHHHHHPTTTTTQHRIHSTVSRRAAAAPPPKHSLDNGNNSPAFSRPHRLPLDRPSSLVSSSSSPLHPLPLKPRWNFLPSSASSDHLFSSSSSSSSSPSSDPQLSASVATVTSTYSS